MLRLFDNRFSARLTYFKGENPANPVNRVNSVVVDHERIISAFRTSINPATGQPYLTRAESNDISSPPTRAATAGFACRSRLFLLFRYVDTSASLKR